MSENNDDLEHKTGGIIISCGGTGGHYYPGLAIGRQALSQNINASLYVTGKRREGQLQQAAKYDVPGFGDLACQLPTRPKSALYFITKFPGMYKRAKALLRQRQPEAVLLMGSFAGAAIGLAAWRLKVPLYLHEGNAIIGRANRFFSRWAKILFTTFPAMNGDACRCPQKLLGLPLRQEILQPAEDEPTPELKEVCGLDDASAKLTILIFGGSQGAQSINQFIPAQLKSFNEEQPLRVIHLSGTEQSVPQVKELYDQAGIEAAVLERCEDMLTLMQAADFAICRAGASSISELALTGLPSLLIPFPAAADNHQHFNARIAEKSGAAQLLSESQMQPEKLALKLAPLFDSEQRNQMSIAAIELAKPDAAKMLLYEIFG